MSEYVIHKQVQSLGKGAYQRLASGGRFNHSSKADWVGTFGARLASWFFPDILWRVTRRSAPRFNLSPSTAKTLYLTIDDGPTADGTGPLLEVLNRFGVKTTMFLVGKNVRANPSLVQEIVAAGHVLGNHTETHLDPWTSNYEEIIGELSRADELLSSLINQPLRWVRPPQGHFTAGMRSWCQQKHQSLVLWDLLPADFSPNCPHERIVSFTLRHVRPGGIVVLHDNDRTIGRTPRALAEILPRLIDGGWSFEALPGAATARPLPDSPAL